MISGCYSTFEWERWEYVKEEKNDHKEINASLMPTRYGKRGLSSKGPFRLVLHEKKSCDDIIR